MDPIPAFDIGALAGSDATARQVLARRIGQACRETGFFAVTGHGVPQPLIDSAFHCARQLFALSHADKQALAIARHGHNRGYVGLGVEALDPAAAADHKEAFNLVWTDGATRPPNVWPPIPHWREPMQACFDALLDVGRRLHRAFALDLDLPEDFFADKLDRPQATLRLLRYPASAQAGAGTHTDYGNLTLLATDGVAGLQVRRRDGQWIEVPALPGGFVCNIGDCLMRWSNGVYQSTPHRVRAPARERQSIAFFLDPNPDAWVQAIPSCVPPGEAPLHAPVTAGDYLRERFEATYTR